jgi:hypothetical protein
MQQCIRVGKVVFGEIRPNIQSSITILNTWEAEEGDTVLGGQEDVLID